MKLDSASPSHVRPPAWVALVVCAAFVVACSEPGPDISSAGDPSGPIAESDDEATAQAAITASTVLENERFWPEIVSIVESWTPADGSPLLKKGYRGALMRVEDDLRVRLAFGRHGDHDVPLEKTDLLARANEIRAGTRHKMGPSFVMHFGAQFLDPALAQPAPFSTVELLKSKFFLCVFLDPRRPEFPSQVESLVQAQELPDLRAILFPVGMPASEYGVVHAALVAVDWLVPYAYPGAADVQARSLLGEVPETPTALLISAEGRVLLRAPLGTPDLAHRIREAAGLPTRAAPAEAPSTPPSPGPDTTGQARG